MDSNRAKYSTLDLLRCPNSISRQSRICGVFYSFVTKRVAEKSRSGAARACGRRRQSILRQAEHREQKYDRGGRTSGQPVASTSAAITWAHAAATRTHLIALGSGIRMGRSHKLFEERVPRPRVCLPGACPPKPWCRWEGRSITRVCHIARSVSTQAYASIETGTSAQSRKPSTICSSSGSMGWRSSAKGRSTKCPDAADW